MNIFLVFMEVIVPNQKLDAVQLLSIREAAAVLVVSQDFVRDEIRRKRLAHNRLGRRFYISPADLAEYLQRTRVAAV